MPGTEAHRFGKGQQVNNGVKIELFDTLEKFGKCMSGMFD